MRTMMIAVVGMAMAGATMLAGCAGTPPIAQSPTPAPVPPAPEPMAACKADAGQRFVAQRLQPSTPDAARLATGASTVRVIRPGTMVTRDYRLDRLNVDVDAGGRVTKVYCG